MHCFWHWFCACYAHLTLAPVLGCSRRLFLYCSLDSACPSGLRSPIPPFSCSYVTYWFSVCTSALVHSCHMASYFPLDTVIHWHYILSYCLCVCPLHHANKSHVLIIIIIIIIIIITNRCTNLSNLFLDFRPDPADRKLSANLYDIYHCWVYSEKLLMMNRGTVRNM